MTTLSLPHTTSRVQHLLLLVANAALDQPHPTKELRLALETLLQEAQTPPVAHRPVKPLSPGEVIVAHMIAANGRMTAKEIATLLGLKESTIEKRIESIANKLHNPDSLKPMKLIAQWGAKAA